MQRFFFSASRYPQVVRRNDFFRTKNANAMQEPFQAGSIVGCNFSSRSSLICNRKAGKLPTTYVNYFQRHLSYFRRSSTEGSPEYRPLTSLRHEPDSPGVPHRPQATEPPSPPSSLRRDHRDLELVP